MNDDFTRVLLTPIIDVDYYLPQFSKYNPGKLFRKKTEYKSICKVADLSFDVDKIQPPEIPEKKDKKDKKENKDNNTPLKEPKNNEENKTLTPTPTPTATPKDEKE